MKIVDFSTRFDDIYELNYNLMNVMGFHVDRNGYIMDEDLGNIISFGGKYVIVNVSPNNIHYAGQNEIMLDILGNVRQMTTLFGYFLDKKQKLDGMKFISYFTDEHELDNGDKLTNVTIKFDEHNNCISSFAYKNKCLKFIDMIFRLEDEIHDLSNFDIEESQLR